MFSFKFHEKFNVNKEKKPTGKCAKIKGFCERWNRVAASALAILTFILLLAYVIYTAVCDKTVIIVTPDDDYRFPIYDHNLESGFRDLFTSKCTFSDCHMKCSEINSTEELFDYLQLYNKTECSTLNVTLWNMNFTNGSIDNNWLESDALRPINTFVVFETNLWNIGVLAFAANVFDKLFILSIVDSKMSKLQKFSFLNVPVNILVFGFTESKSSDVDFGDCVLEGMKTLKQLKIFNAINNPEQVHSLVGTRTVTLPSIRTVHLEQNSLHQLTDDSFHSVPNLRKLVLRGNRISTIEPNAFRNVENLKYLDLSDNDLITLPSSFATTFQNITEIHLHHNEWICNCSLQWLQELVLSSEQVANSDQMSCSNLNWTPFASADFGCKGISSTDTPENRVASLEITITATDLMKAMLPVEEPWQSSFILSSVENQTTMLVLNGLYLETGVYEMGITGDAKNFHLIWYNNQNWSEYNSVRDIKGTVVMEGIQLKTPYTFCVIMSPKQDSSPFDCLPPMAEPPPKAPDEAQRKVYIGICIGIILATAIVSAFATFYYIRQNPQLLVGNKRVVLVNSMTTDAVILPKGYKKQEKISNACEAGYMIPRAEKLVTRKIIQGRTSESSNMSGISYIATDDAPPKTSPRPSLEDKNISDNIYESLPTSEYCKYESKILE